MTTNEYYVYSWTRPDTGAVFYVGKGKGDRDAKPKIHNPIFLNIVAKLKNGGLVPKVTRISEGLSEEEAFTMEREEIAKWGRKNNGTGCLANLTDGGEGRSGAIVSSETKLRQSVAVTKKLADPAIRKKLSDAMLRRFSDPAERRLLGAAVSLRYEDPAEREKMAAPLRGVPKSPEHVAAARRSLIAAWQNGHLRTRHRKKSLLRGPSRANTSGYKGVSFDKSSRKWMAQVEVDGRNKHLGRYDTPESAAVAYDAGVTLYYGHDVYLNFPPANDNSARSGHDQHDLNGWRGRSQRRMKTTAALSHGSHIAALPAPQSRQCGSRLTRWWRLGTAISANG